MQCVVVSQCVAVAVWCSVVQCVAECCSVGQCGAVCCSALQCVAVWCSALCHTFFLRFVSRNMGFDSSVWQRVAEWCSALQCCSVLLLQCSVAVCCSALQCVAVCCSVRHTSFLSLSQETWDLIAWSQSNQSHVITCTQTTLTAPQFEF